MHKSYLLDLDGCRYGMSMQYSYLNKFSDELTMRHDPRSFDNGRDGNFNFGSFHTPANRKGTVTRVPDYYRFDSELQFGVLYMIDLSNVLYGNIRVNNDNIAEIIRMLISKNGQVATGSLISGSCIEKTLVDEFVDMGFCVYNEERRKKELGVDIQLMYYMSTIIGDPRRRERHYTPGLCHYYPHFSSVLLVTSDYNKSNGISFPDYMNELLICGISVKHYDAIKFDNPPKMKVLASLTNFANYSNPHIDEIIDCIKLKYILLPTINHVTLVEHELIIKNGYYYVRHEGYCSELNEYIQELNEIWYYRLDVYNLAAMQLQG